MKETMETLKCKAVHVAAGAAQTARLVALISKKKFAILAEQDKIRRCYTQLGKVYYKDYVTDEEPDDAEYDPLCERISQSFRRINRLRLELEAAKTKLAGEQPEDEAEPEAKPETEPETETAAEEEDFADNETPAAPEENSSSNCLNVENTARPKVSERRFEGAYFDKLHMNVPPPA